MTVHHYALWTGYTAEIDVAIAQVDINRTIEQLRNLSTDFGTLGQTSLQVDLSDIILELENIRDNLVPNLRASVVRMCHNSYSHFKHSNSQFSTLIKLKPHP